MDTAHTWNTHGIHGIHMEYTWNTYGIHIEYTRNTQARAVVLSGIHILCLYPVSFCSVCPLFVLL
jgi:hypothetical protein